ncbi:MAG: hypothetical protein ACLUIQ_01775 [Dialister invisus]
MQEHLKIAYSRKALETFGAVEKGYCRCISNGFYRCGRCGGD